MLTNQQITIIVETMKPFNPLKIGIFGSVARGEEHQDSDIDILYEFKEPVGLFKLIGLKQRMEQLLHRKIDLVSEKYLNPKLKSHVMRDLNLIYEG
ncbi:MAG: nucleotidyltransferase family protein [Mangrovibacterium sp.]